MVGRAHCEGHPELHAGQFKTQNHSKRKRRSIEGQVAHTIDHIAKEDLELVPQSMPDRQERASQDNNSERRLTKEERAEIEFEMMSSQEKINEYLDQELKAQESRFKKLNYYKEKIAPFVNDSRSL